MKPQDASDVKDERCKSKSSSSNREPMAPLVTPVPGVIEEPVGSVLTACSSVAEVKAEPAVDAWGNYGWKDDLPQDTRSGRRGPRSRRDTFPANAWQTTNALNLDPGNYGGHPPVSGNNAWETTMTDDTDARWELHRGPRAAPSNPVFPSYHARMNRDRAGETLSWSTWRCNDFAAAARRWDTGPYGSDRPKGRGRGGQW